MTRSKIPALLATMMTLMLLLGACGTADLDTADTDTTDTDDTDTDTDDADTAEPADGEDYTLAFAVRAVLGTLERGRVGKEAKVGKGRRGRSHVPTFQRSIVVCNLSTSLVVEDAARECGATVVRAPVGEAHVAAKMIELRAPLGGGGNGEVMYAALHVGGDGPEAAARARARRQQASCLTREGRMTICPRRSDVHADAIPGDGPVTPAPSQHA